VPKMELGPWVNAAAFCDSTVLGADGALSIIRIIDTVTQSAEGEEPPEQMPPFAFNTKLVIALKAGEAKGRYTLRFRPEAPDGRHLPVQDNVIHLEGGHSGINLIADVQIGLELEGVYWFDILFVAAPDEEHLLTRVPLRVLYAPQKTRAGRR